MLHLTRRYALSLLHKIPEDSAGECTRLHGHDFKLEVTLRGETHPEHGQLILRSELDRLVHNSILQEFDRSLINEHLRFGTGEFIAQEFLQRLRATAKGHLFVSVQLIETRKNRFQCLAVM